MSEPRMPPPQPLPAPEIGDVLASIRRLISQDGMSHDGESAAENEGVRELDPAVSHDTDGSAAAVIRNLIRHDTTEKVAAPRLPEDRLVLSTPSRVPGAVTLVPESSDNVLAADVTEGAGIGQSSSADLSASLPDSANRLPAEPAQSPGAHSCNHDADTENQMMLAEISKEQMSHSHASREKDEFDLFATESAEEDDPISGGNALRSLVRDVIRQELQGEMGDRISRNLRRAIRQEVASTITAGLKTV